MKKLLGLAIITEAIAFVAGGWFAVRHFRNERNEKVHFERQETELIITNLANAPLHLFKAGNRLQDAIELKDFAGSQAMRV